MAALEIPKTHIKKRDPIIVYRQSHGDEGSNSLKRTKDD